MDVFMELLRKLLQAGLQLLMNPFYYAGILFILLQYRKQIQFERKLFHIKLHSLLGETWRTLLWGWAAGFGASLVLALVGVSLSGDAVFIIWGLSILMIFFRVRFLCLAYSVGVLGILHVIFSFVPGASEWQGVGPVLKLIKETDIPSLLVIVALLHVIEGVLVRFEGARMASPQYYEWKRGRIIGGYRLQGFWPVPLFLIVPMQGGSVDSLPWSTLFGGEAMLAGWGMIAFPAMIGFSSLTVSRLARDKAHWNSNMLVLYGLILLLAAVAAHVWSPFTIAAAVLGIALHEGILWYGRWKESNGSPIFVHSTKGLTVLAVLPGSAAEELGVQAGETIHKVNGFKIRSKADLHHAMQLNSAFCKLEVLNLQGEVRFLQRAIFSGEHHQLGIILAPDQQTMHYVETKQSHMFAYLRGKLSGLLTNDSGKPM